MSSGADATSEQIHQVRGALIARLGLLYIDFMFSQGTFRAAMFLLLNDGFYYDRPDEVKQCFDIAKLLGLLVVVNTERVVVDWHATCALFYSR